MRVIYFICTAVAEPLLLELLINPWTLRLDARSLIRAVHGSSLVGIQHGFYENAISGHQILRAIPIIFYNCLRYHQAHSKKER